MAELRRLDWREGVSGPDLIETPGREGAPREHALRESTLREFWRAQLQDLPPLELPSDRERPARSSRRAAEHHFSISSDLAASMRQLAQAHQVTPEIVLLAVYQVLLARLSGQTDFGVAMPVAHTQAGESDALSGPRSNLLITRADLSGEPDFVELLARVGRGWLSIHKHGDLPLEALVAELLPARDPRRAPLADAMFQLVPRGDGAPQLEGLEDARGRDPGRCARFDVELSLSSQGAGMCATLGYCPDIFDSSAGARLAGYYLTLLEAVTADPHRRVSDLPILSAAEAERQLLTWSGASDIQPMDAEDCVQRWFAQQVAQGSERTAVVSGATHLTYRQLDERANQLAHHLLELGVRHEEPVGVHLERSADLVVAILAVLKAGAAYVPLDLRNPVDRLAFIIGDAGVRILITSSGPPAVVQDRVKQVIRMGEGSAWAGSAISAPAAAARATDLACIFYTSGSTGRPKGVEVMHQGIVRLVRHTNHIQLQSTDRVAQATSTSFDVSSFEIWGALLNGAQLMVLPAETLVSPPDLARAIAAQGITALFLTPALFSQLAAADPAMFAPLRYLVVGGDVVDPHAVRAVLAAGAPSHLINGYGPTENSTFSACFNCVGATEAFTSVPIGRPVSGSTCYVLDGRGALLPAGAIGELLVGGQGLARGYLNRPELTAERFIPHPFTPGERLYRTGDRARWRSDGTIDFRGRIDRQIKLRGYRIEPGEIECALAEHEAVEQSMVIAQDRAGERRLFAYWVARAGRAASAHALSAHLRRMLPEYMMPAGFIQMAAFPLNANGKIDTTALPLPPESPLKAAPEGNDARTDLESRIATIWRRLLRTDRIGIQDDFFASGGTSLLAVQTAIQLQDALSRPVSVGDLFSFPTIAGLARALEQRSPAGGVSDLLVAIRPGDTSPPIIFPPDIAGDVAVLDGIRAALPAERPLYAIQDHNDSPRARSIEAMASDYCRAVRLRWPSQPIHLAGYSFSGILAYEMARQLSAERHPIGLLAIIDTGPGGAVHGSARERARAFWEFVQNVPRWIHEDLIRASWDEAPSRLRRSSAKLIKQLFNFGRGARFTPAANDIFDLTGWSASRRSQVDFNLRALENFIYRPYGGRLMLFRAHARPLFHALTRDAGWGPIVRDLKIVDVPGNHVTITRSPRVEALSAAFIAALEDCERPPGGQYRSGGEQRPSGGEQGAPGPSTPNDEPASVNELDEA
jgi:amino acid adenylation domain-containing protein